MRNKMQGVPNFEEETDPAMLQQMQGTPAPAQPQQPQFQEVQDGSELNQLNGQSNIPQGPEPATGIMGNAKRVLGTMAHAKSNADMDTFGSLLSVAQHPNQLGATIAGMAVPEVAFGKAIKYIPDIIKGIANMGARAGATTAIGGAENMGEPGKGSLGEKFMEGAGNTAPYALGAEGVMAPIRAIAGLAESINPQKTAARIANYLRGHYNKGVKAQQEAYAPVHAKFGDQNVTGAPRMYLGFHPQEEEQYFTPNVSRKYREFQDKPTFQNLHELQSTMFRDAASTTSQETQQALVNARKKVNDNISGFLRQDTKQLANYERGRRISRERVFPYMENPTIRNIVDTKRPIENFDPQELHKGLQDTPLFQLSQRGEKDINHPLVKAGHSMNTQVQKAQMMQYGIPASIAGGAAMLSNPSWATALGSVGALGGAALGHVGGITAAKLAQNDLLQKLMRGASRGLYGSIPVLANQP